MAAAALSLVTLGIYALVLVVQWCRWRDGWDRRNRSLNWAGWGIGILAGSLVLVVAAYVAMFAGIFYMEGSEEAAGGDDELPLLFVPFIMGIILSAMVGFAGLLAGRIMVFVAQWRLWTSIQERLASLGRAPRFPPIVLLLVEIFGPQVMQFVAMVFLFAVLFVSVGVFVATGFPPLFMIAAYPFALLMMVLPLLWVLYETQSRVLTVAATHNGTAPWTPPGPSASM